MLRMKAEITGKTQEDLELALDEVKRLVSEGFLTTAGYSDLWFSIEGREEESADD